MNFIRPPTTGGGTKFDYSKIQQITSSMKDKLKQKYESLSTIQNETQATTGDNTTQSSVLDNYITDIENLFLDGVFNGDLRINGIVYATQIQTTEEMVKESVSESVNEPTKILNGKWMLHGFESTKQWSKLKIEDSELYRCRLYNAEFVNETVFRDNIQIQGTFRANTTGFQANGNGTTYSGSVISSRAYATTITNYGSAWDSTTGYFTPKIPGLYYVSASAQLTSTTLGAAATMTNVIRKNAGQTSEQTIATLSNSWTTTPTMTTTSTCTAFIYMNGTTDTLSTWTTNNIIISTNSTFMAFLVMAT